MRNIIDNVIAGIVLLFVSATLAFILQHLGFSAQLTIGVPAALFALAILFLVARKFYPAFKMLLTERLLKAALNKNVNDTSEVRVTFKKKIVELVFQENLGSEQKQSNSIIEFPNQDACESKIKDACRSAKKVKILTIRGEKYFSSTATSWFYNLLRSK